MKQIFTLILLTFVLTACTNKNNTEEENLPIKNSEHVISCKDSTNPLVQCKEDAIY